MASIRYIVNDILTSLKQKFADKDITFSHALWWTIVYADRLKSQHLQKYDSGAFLHIYDDVNIQVDTTNGRKYIELPENVYDFDKDRGIDYIAYNWDVDTCSPSFTSTQFIRTEPNRAWLLYTNTDEAPTTTNPYFYRVGSRVYLLGIECVNIPHLECGLYGSLNPLTVCDLDAEFDFPNELISVLQAQVLQLGTFVLRIPTDRLNDGDDSSIETAAQLQATTKAASQQAMVQTQQEATE